MIIRLCAIEDIGAVARLAFRLNTEGGQATSFMYKHYAKVEASFAASLGKDSLQAGAFEGRDCLGYIHIVLGTDYVPGDVLGPFYAEGREDLVKALLDFGIAQLASPLDLKFNLESGNGLGRILLGLGAEKTEDNYMLEILARDLAPSLPAPEALALEALAIETHSPDQDGPFVELFEAAFQDAYMGSREALEAGRGADYRLLDLLEDGSLVGFGLYRIDRGYVDFLAVREDRRGRGYGHVLLRAVLEDLLKARGMPSAVLNVDLANEAALGLYTGLGFKVKEHFVAYRLGKDRQVRSGA